MSIQTWTPDLNSRPELQTWTPDLNSRPELQTWTPDLNSRPELQTWTPDLNSIAHDKWIISQIPTSKTMPWSSFIILLPQLITVATIDERIQMCFLLENIYTNIPENDYDMFRSLQDLYQWSLINLSVEEQNQ